LDAGLLNGAAHVAASINAVDDDKTVILALESETRFHADKLVATYPDLRSRAWFTGTSISMGNSTTNVNLSRQFLINISDFGYKV
jgi:hypothetical protein